MGGDRSGGELEIDGGLIRLCRMICRLMRRVLWIR